MIGAIIGDVVGSRFEFINNRSKDFEFFSKQCTITDDSVMTIAVANAILKSGCTSSLSQIVVEEMQTNGKKYPYAGYGLGFQSWMESESPEPYNSWGNGAAMRVSACGFAAKSLEEAISLSKTVTEVTHNHPEGIKGAEATIVAIFMARTGKSISEIKDYITSHYYNIDFTLDEIRDSYTFDVSCQGSVPQALEAFFESESFEDAIRNAISIGGDSDTIAAITGGIAEAYYGVPKELRDEVTSFLDEYQLRIITDFEARYPAKFV